MKKGAILAPLAAIPKQAAPPTPLTQEATVAPAPTLETPPPSSAAAEKLISSLPKRERQLIVRPTQAPQEGKVPRPEFTPQQKSYLMALYRSPLFQKMFESVVGGTIYDTFFKTKTGKNNELSALADYPKPWEKFLVKPSYFQLSRNWLYDKTRGFLGKKLPLHAEHYDFPATKEGTRAQLLKILAKQYPEQYIKIWTEEDLWNDLWKNIDKNTKQKLEKVGGTPIEFGEYWLQMPLKLKKKKAIAPAKSGKAIAPAAA
jgi:hypothetical protein